ncbi:conserved hypothetical protein [Neospora caninum Liverpool]|uniref:Uncharacterized protein n=1 Tax=Neospora caninum (strain Liverpool) TaxID=572307 RepID=F0V718_NEOCL|nr:conserved hypothetical protein [Neospora caninum Liverpool]CBZ49509.1 conserved hypothetical protein [Neospora caninum Liverpool]CEL64088.1 TPA: hypothetical protein BN1204_000070 [Neospora caninum Liverpool]|eukprot:XP_003879544.1 conserved hypothetical protein [Neospora caninum Liverpool]
MGLFRKRRSNGPAFPNQVCARSGSVCCNNPAYEILLSSRPVQQTGYDPLVNALVQENIYYQQLLAEQQEQLSMMAPYQNIQCSPFWSEPEPYWHSGTTYGNYFCSPGACWQVDEDEVIQNEEWSY